MYNFSLPDSNFGFGSMNIRSIYKMNTEENVNKIRLFVQKELEKENTYVGVNVVLINWIRLNNMNSL